MTTSPVIAIMGPTASGKSALALELARRFNGEIISVDSMQLYRGLEIGTAQPTAAERAEIPHHLVGIYDFSERAEVFTFCRLAEQAIAGARARGRLPILVGGTGFYFKALLYGLDDLPADPALRRELNEKYDSDEAEPALHELMKQTDPEALARWHTCRRRLIRALEVKLLCGRSLLELQQGSASRRRRDDVRMFTLMPEADELKQKINRRTGEMLAAGWIEEARTAIAAGLQDSPTAYQALGYRLIGEMLAGRLPVAELPGRIAVATWQYARRQRTWFRHQHPEALQLTGADISLPRALEKISNPAYIIEMQQ